MHVLRDKKLWKAVVVALGLYVLVPMGVVHIRGLGSSVWATRIWPTFWPFFVAIPIAIVAIATGCLLRPQHPQRLAAWMGGLGAVLCIGLHELLPWAWGRVSLSQGLGVAVMFPGYYACPLAVACWIGADYWLRESEARFWRGPSGAMLRGGLAAGVLFAAVSLAIWHWMPRYEMSVATWKVAEHALMGLSAVPKFTVLAAVLARSRPSPSLGAFAAAGIASGLIGLGVGTVMRPLLSPLPQGFASPPLLVGFAADVVAAAIAGSFAGRWTSEPLPDE